MKKPPTIQLPTTTPGRRGPDAQAQYGRELDAFCAGVKACRSRVEFPPTARGWCYLLEEYGLRKGDFDRAERLITECRKNGSLPVEITAEDDTRETIGLEPVHDMTPAEYAQRCLDDAVGWLDEYTPTSFWEEQDVYVEMVVEKLDLRELFKPVCARCHVALTPLRGWTDLWSRVRILERVHHWAAKGKRIVLLACVDHDPGGLQIADKLSKNLHDLRHAVGWDPLGVVEVVRFGLTAPFITRHRLTWIENLETASGRRLDDPKHPDHDKPYVRDYIRQFGVRKVEANALIVRPDAGRQLCAETLARYIEHADLDRYAAALTEARAAGRGGVPHGAASGGADVDAGHTLPVIGRPRDEDTRVTQLGLFTASHWARATRGEVERGLDRVQWRWSRRLSLWVDALVLIEEAE